jgi:hypothetical protein
MYRSYLPSFLWIFSVIVAAIGRIGCRFRRCAGAIANLFSGTLCGAGPLLAALFLSIRGCVRISQKSHQFFCDYFLYFANSLK